MRSTNSLRPQCLGETRAFSKALKTQRGLKNWAVRNDTKWEQQEFVLYSF